MTGLEVNWEKSVAFGINLDATEESTLADTFGCQIGKLPGIYLGLPLGSNTRKAETWRPVVEKIEKRLAGWKSSSLSRAGKLVLIRTVLESIPIYYMSLFKMPKKIVKKINAIQRRFLWCNGRDKGLALMRWSRLARPKEAGGLGICDIETKNAALLFRWWWKYHQDGDKLWKKIMAAVHGVPVSLPVTDTLWSTSKQAGAWKSILSIQSWTHEIKETLINNLKWVVRNGETTRFWLDPWLGEFILKDKFPRLYSISQCKTAKICEVGTWNGNAWTWNLRWRRTMFVYESEEVDRLLRTINESNVGSREGPDGGADSLVWLAERSGVYTVKSLYNTAMSKYPAPDISWHIANWSKCAPPRVELFTWFLLNGKLATRDRLFGLNLTTLGSVLCPLCQRAVESIEHLFFRCRQSRSFWGIIGRWWGVDLILDVELQEAWKNWCEQTPSARCRKLWLSTFMFCVYNLWFLRNKMVFEQESADWSKLALSTKLQILSWCSKCSNVAGETNRLLFVTNLKELV